MKFFGFFTISVVARFLQPLLYLRFTPYLIRGFNAFIPNHCKELSCHHVQETEMGVQETDVSDKRNVLEKIIQVPKKISRKDVLRGVEFVNRVQRRLKKHPRTMREFYHVIRKYGNNHGVRFLKRKLSVIFNKYPELELEFSRSNEDNAEEEKNDMDDFEDAMSEVDVLMNWMLSAKDATKKLFEACEENSTEKIEVANYLSSMNLRSIEKLYGDGTGNAVVELLHQSPRRVSSIILPRLSEKLEEIIAEQIEIHSIVNQFHIGR